MTSDVHTAAGAKIYIGTTAAATNQTEYEADTYAEIGEVVGIGEFGRRYNPVTHTSLGSRDVKKFKGSRDDGDIQLGLAKKTSDAGQAAAKAALDTDDDYNFKVVENDEPTGGTGTTQYFKGKVMSYVTGINDAESIVGVTIDIAIKSGSTIEVAAAGP